MCKVTRIRLLNKSGLFPEVCLTNMNFRYDGEKLEIQNLTWVQASDVARRLYDGHIIKEHVAPTVSEGDGVHVTFVLKMSYRFEIKIECYDN